MLSGLPEQTPDELKAENAHLRDVIDDQRQTIVMLARMLSEASRPANRVPHGTPPSINVPHGTPPSINLPGFTVPTVPGEAV